MEGQGVDGHVGDEPSPKRNAFIRVFENVSLPSLFSLLFVGSCLVLSCLVLSCLVLSCLVVCVCVCVGVCVLARSTLRELECNSFIRYSE